MTFEVLQIKDRNLKTEISAYFKNKSEHIAVVKFRSPV